MLKCDMSPEPPSLCLILEASDSVYCTCHRLLWLGANYLCCSWGSGNTCTPLPCSIDSKSIMTLSELELQEWLITGNINRRCILSMCWFYKPLGFNGRGRGRATNTPSLKSHKQQNAITSKNSSQATKNGSFLGRISTRTSNFARKIVLDTGTVQLVFGGVFSEAP